MDELTKTQTGEAELIVLRSREPDGMASAKLTSIGAPLLPPILAGQFTHETRSRVAFNAFDYFDLTSFNL